MKILKEIPRDDREKIVRRDGTVDVARLKVWFNNLDLEVS